MPVAAAHSAERGGRCELRPKNAVPASTKPRRVRPGGSSLDRIAAAGCVRSFGSLFRFRVDPHSLGGVEDLPERDAESLGLDGDRCVQLGLHHHVERFRRHDALELRGLQFRRRRDPRLDRNGRLRQRFSRSIDHDPSHGECRCGAGDECVLDVRGRHDVVILHAGGRLGDRPRGFDVCVRVDERAFRDAARRRFLEALCP